MNNDKMIAHVTAQLNLAAQLQAEGRKPQMIAVLRQDAVAARKFVSTCPDIPQAKLLLASILGDIGKLGEAIALAKNAAKKSRINPQCITASECSWLASTGWQPAVKPRFWVWLT